MAFIEGIIRKDPRTNPRAEVLVVDTENASSYTLQNAIDACIADRGDIILVLPDTMSVTATVAFDCAGITVRAATGGYSSYDRGEKTTIWAGAAFTDGPVATVTAPCTIEGLGFSSRWAAGSAFYVNGEGGGFAGGFCHFKNLRFPGWGGETYAMDFDAGAYNLIEGCSFDAAFTAAIAFGGSASNNPDHNKVLRCDFINATYAIEHLAGGTPHHMRYQENSVIDGKFINFNDQAADGLACGNWLETATDTGSYDITVAAAQVHGFNFSDNHYSE